MNGGGNIFVKSVMPSKKRETKPPPEQLDDNNLDDSRPSVHTSESQGSKKSSSGWRKVLKKISGVTKNKQQTQTNTGTTAAKTSSQGEETKKEEEELNVQVVEDIDIRDQQDFNKIFKESQYQESQSEEEHEDV